MLEQWWKQDECDPAKLRARAEALLAREDTHPVVRALWTPRLTEAIDWIAASMADDLAKDRRPIAAEEKGIAEAGGVTLEAASIASTGAATAASRSSTIRPASRRPTRRSRTAMRCSSACSA